MKNKYLVIILIALLALPVVSVSAANEVTFSQDTTLDMVSPDTDIIIQANSIVDSITTGDSSITVVISTGGLLKLRSNDRYTMTASTVDADLNSSCTDSYYYLTITPRSSASAESFTVTVSDTVCTVAVGSGNVGGGGGGGGGATTTTTTDTTVTTDTAATETSGETTTATPTTTTTQTASPTPGIPQRDASGKVTLPQQAADAAKVATGDVSQLLAAMGVSRDTTAEANYGNTIVANIVKGAGVTAAVRNTITNFVTYGTPATKILGAGERAGVVNSYRAAFGKLPVTSEEWNDVIKIANGRWPTARSESKENTAKTSFRTIYLREPNMSQSNDNAAVTVMAYGLRPADRNLESEKAAIKSFKAIFGLNPTSASNWDAVRAIAYSGATR